MHFSTGPPVAGNHEKKKEINTLAAGLDLDKGANITEWPRE